MYIYMIQKYAKGLPYGTTFTIFNHHPIKMIWPKASKAMFDQPEVHALGDRRHEEQHLLIRIIVLLTDLSICSDTNSNTSTNNNFSAFTKTISDTHTNTSFHRSG